MRRERDSNPHETLLLTAFETAATDNWLAPPCYSLYIKSEYVFVSE
jgi:hypothetical protein